MIGEGLVVVGIPLGGDGEGLAGVGVGVGEGLAGVADGVGLGEGVTVGVGEVEVGAVVGALAGGGGEEVGEVTGEATGVELLGDDTMGSPTAGDGVESRRHFIE